MSQQKIIFLFLFVLLLTSQSIIEGISQPSQAMKTPFENNDNYSATYKETIEYYNLLADHYDELRISPFGMSDSGFPLHEVIIDKNKAFDPSSSKRQGKAILMVNNAIHPGEPCGVDASMMLARDLLSSEQGLKLLDHTVIVIIPFYNISGGLNRGSFSRANQNGPEEYGFRGNAQNLDLNRDFIKCDTKNAESFNKLFNKWDPDVFIDNHTSNGADYQYVITLIATQKDKLESHLSTFMQQQMLPDLYKKMEKSGFEMTPYVYARRTPDDGIAGFLDLPRYSSGYAALHNTISFMPETHMLKPFKDRVWSVYHFMQSMLEHLKDKKGDLINARVKANEAIATSKSMDLNWTLDVEAKEEIEFKGYEAGHKSSEISGLERLYYDRTKPFTKIIPYFNTYKSTLSIEKPKAYVIPQAYRKIIERLKWNNVKIEVLASDTIMEVTSYRIEDYKSPERPYEGHYLHTGVVTTPVKKMLGFRKGDILIPTGQEKDRYIVETLEPQAPDSFFAWNFMDGILMSKEYFSSYVFEDRAVEILKNDPSLKEALEAKKNEDPGFAENARAQLRFIYERSPHYEQQYMNYPILRID